MLTPTIVAHASPPEAYQSATVALAQRKNIDECKDWSDRAASLASHAKQAADEESVQKARMIRNRAIRRTGEVLTANEPVNAARDRKDGGDFPLSRKDAAAVAGISERQTLNPTQNIRPIANRHFFPDQTEMRLSRRA